MSVGCGCGYRGGGWRHPDGRGSSARHISKPQTCCRDCCCHPVAFHPQAFPSHTCVRCRSAGVVAAVRPHYCRCCRSWNASWQGLRSKQELKRPARPPKMHTDRRSLRARFEAPMIGRAHHRLHGVLMRRCCNRQTTTQLAPKTHTTCMRHARLTIHRARASAHTHALHRRAAQQGDFRREP